MEQLAQILEHLEAALELADEIGEHAVAATIAHPLELIQNRFNTST